jgi:hypothetical protein
MHKERDMTNNEIRPIVTLCGWCPDAREKTQDAKSRGFDVSHGMCATCSTKMHAQLDALEAR